MSHQPKSSIGALHRAHCFNDEIQVLNIILHRDLTHRIQKCRGAAPNTMKSTTFISKTPRILHVVNSLNRGGLETWLIRLLQEIDRNKFSIDICCREPELACLSRHALDAGAQVCHVPWEPTGILYGPRFKKFLQKHQYDLLHTHVLTSCGIETVAAASLGIPAVFTGHRCSPVSQNKIVSLPGIRQIRRTLMNHSFALLLSFHRTSRQYLRARRYHTSQNTLLVPIGGRHYGLVLRYAPICPLKKSAPSQRIRSTKGHSSSHTCCTILPSKKSRGCYSYF